MLCFGLVWFGLGWLIGWLVGWLVVVVAVAVAVAVAVDVLLLLLLMMMMKVEGGFFEGWFQWQFVVAAKYGLGVPL